MPAMGAAAEVAPPRIAVYGAGGVGGYFGGRLAVAGADVRLIARGRQLEALQAGPLRVRSVAGDLEVTVPATDEPAEIGACDAVLVCVKSYDTETVARSLVPLLGDGTAAVSLQNGVDNVERLVDAVGSEHVLGGAAFIFATLTEPGLIVDSGGPGSIVLGELNGSISERAAGLAELLARAGVDAEAVSDIQARLWGKFAFICAQAGMTAGTKLPIGAIRASKPAWAMFRRLAEEVAELAAAEDVVLPPDTVEGIMEFAAGLEHSSTPSLHTDLVKGRPTELEALHGLVVRRARAHGLSTPMNESVYALLAPYAAASG